MEKVTLIAPVTALDYSDFTSEAKGRIFVGVGGEIRSYEGNEELKRTVFESHSVHGIRAIKDVGKIVVFGDKEVALLDATDLMVRSKLSPLCDMVRDCCVMIKQRASEGLTHLLVAFANNFVEVLEVQGNQHRSLRRVHAPEKCVLFSLHFSSACVHEGQSLMMASGNAFGKVTLWDFPYDEGWDGARVPARITVTTHQGVIFRTRWSTDQKYIATVADDRTVRVFDISERGGLDDEQRQVFEGWGHISRVWDVVFVSGPSLIASASEDGTVKIWDFLLGQCMATLSGHHGDVWRLAAPMNGQYIISGGNDSSVKMWSVASAMQSCQDDKVASVASFCFPSAIAATNIDSAAAAEAAAAAAAGGAHRDQASKSDSKRRNGTSGLCASPDGRFVVICLCNGVVWMVDRGEGGPPPSSTPHSGGNPRPAPPSPSASFGAWTPLDPLRSDRVISADAYFTVDRDGTAEQCVLACSHPDGSVSLDIYALISSRRHGSGSGCEPSLPPWEKRHSFHWKAHERKCTSVHLVSRGQGQGQGQGLGQVLLVSATVQGHFKLWGVPSGGGGGGGDDTRPELVLTGCTRHSGKNREGQIVSAACYLPSPCPTVPPTLIVGDIKGAITVFPLGVPPRADDAAPAAAANDKGGEVREPAQIITEARGRRLHGGESISCLTPCLSGFLSGGGDATLKRFFRCTTDGISASAGAGADRAIFRCTGLLSCLPIRAPMKIALLPPAATEGHSSSSNPSAPHPAILVGGFYSSKYLVVDITRSITLLRVEGGNWQRPHHCIMPPTSDGSDGSGSGGGRGPHFISVAPAKGQGARDCVIQECVPVPSFAPAGAGAGVPAGVTQSHNGAVNYSAAVLRPGLHCVGGEEGRIKVYSKAPPSPSASPTMPGGGDAAGGAVRLLEELSLRGNAPVKALCSANAPHGRVLIGAGSRLCYSVWMYRPDEGHIEDREGVTGLERELSDLRYEGCLQEDAEQEYRILCGSALYCPDTQCFLCVLCDSQGRVTPLLVAGTRHSAGAGGGDGGVVRRLPSLQASTSPVLCCDMAPLPCSSSSSSSSDPSSSDLPKLCVFGTSAGEVAVWMIGAAGMQSATHTPAVRLLQYSANSFGANCLAMRVRRAEGGTWTVVVCSGGDDQALTASIIRLTLGEEGQVRVQSHLVASAAGAAGAAFKGLCFLPDSTDSEDEGEGEGEGEGKSIAMVTMAADQRVQCWDVEPSLIGECAMLPSPFVEGSPFRWRHGLVSGITDPQCMACGGGEVLVAGEGNETIQIKM